MKAITEKVVFDSESKCGYFTYMGFVGDVQRRPAEKPAWRGTIIGWTDHIPEHWREYKLPIKRGNTRSTVVVQACEHAKQHPIVIVNGYYGSFETLE